ncbi:hypothetical protein [Streptomyces spectabilis]|uniref:hypothetical protein n=1 Tax=Streptomyces spectabilis TaxID=68270 RepID=UPI00340F447F
MASLEAAQNLLCEVGQWTARGVEGLLPPVSVLGQPLAGLLVQLEGAPGERVDNGSAEVLDQAAEDLAALVTQITEHASACPDLHTWPPIKAELDGLTRRLEAYRNSLARGLPPGQDAGAGLDEVHVPLKYEGQGDDMLPVSAAAVGDDILARDGLPARITALRREKQMTVVLTDAGGTPISVRSDEALPRASRADTRVYDASGQLLGRRVRLASAKSGDRISFTADWRALDVHYAANGLLTADVEDIERPQWIKVEATVDATYDGVPTAVPLTDVLIQHPGGVIEHAERIAFACPPHHVIHLQRSSAGAPLTRADLVPQALPSAQLSPGAILVHEGRSGALVLDMTVSDHGTWAHLLDRATQLHSHHYIDDTPQWGLPATEETIRAAVRALGVRAAYGLRPHLAHTPAASHDDQHPGQEAELWTWVSTQADALVRALHRAQPGQVHDHPLTVISKNAQLLRRYPTWRMNPQVLAGFRTALHALTTQDREIARFTDALCAALEYAFGRLRADPDLGSAEQRAAAHYAPPGAPQAGQNPAGWRRQLVASTSSLRHLLRTTPPEPGRFADARARVAAAGADTLELVGKLAIYADHRGLWRVIMPATGTDLIPAGRADDAAHAAWIAGAIQAAITDADGEPFPYDAPNVRAHLPGWRTRSGSTLAQAVSQLLAQIVAPVTPATRAEILSTASAGGLPLGPADMQPVSWVLLQQGPAHWLRVEQLNQESFTTHLHPGSHPYESALAVLSQEVMTALVRSRGHRDESEPLPFEAEMAPAQPQSTDSAAIHQGAPIGGSTVDAPSAALTQDRTATPPDAAPFPAPTPNTSASEGLGEALGRRGPRAPLLSGTL